MSDHTESERELMDDVDQLIRRGADVQRATQRLKARSIDLGYLMIGELRPDDELQFVMRSMLEGPDDMGVTTRTLSARRHGSQCGSLYVVTDTVNDGAYAGQQLYFGSELSGGKAGPGIIIPLNRVLLSRDDWETSNVLPAYYNNIQVNDAEMF